MPFKRPRDGSSSYTDDEMMDIDDMDRDIDDNASDDDQGRDLFGNLDEYASRDYSGVPLILPRRRFAGARNVVTIKDGRIHLRR
jgi:hypothetical protein